MDLLEYHVNNRIGYITLNRPAKRNALSPELVSELRETFLQADQDDQVKVIVLKANGEVFCSGADLAYLQAMQHYSYEENLADSENLKELFLQIYTLRKVVIAQVQGHALAGGCGLATVCDFCIASEEAKFGYTEVKIGFVPAIVMVFLIRKIGEGKARELLLAGNTVSADEARSIGLVNKVSEKSALEIEVDTLAEYLIASNSENSMALTKKMMAMMPTLSLDEALRQASEINARARASEDCKKGVSAFLQKKKISW